MSPEQIQGVLADQRSDIFSLGIVFYRMLTGERPFQAESFAGISYKILNEEPVPPKHLNPLLPEACNKIIAKMLAKDPLKRYQTIKSFREDIWKLQSQDFSSFESSGAIEQKAFTTKSTPIWKKRFIIHFTGALLILCIAIILYLLVAHSMQKPTIIPPDQGGARQTTGSLPIDTKSNDFAMFRQFGINFFNNGNHAKAAVNFLHALEIKNTDAETHNYLMKSIEQLLKTQTSCTINSPVTALINISSNKFVPGYLLVAQDNTLCFTTPTTDNSLAIQIKIIPIKTLIDFYFLSELDKQLMKTRITLEAQDNKTYNVQLDFNKEKNILETKSIGW